MPLPRFTRLPPERQAAITAIAREHFARDGRDGASYNQIIAACDISKASAYNYFDGKADLHALVLGDVETRVQGVLGRWEPASNPEEFWVRLSAAIERLLTYLAENPEDRALLTQGRRDSGPQRWTVELIDDAVRLGLLAPDERTLIGVVTQGVLDALDAYALANPDRAAEVGEQLPRLLARLWGTLS